MTTLALVLLRRGGRLRPVVVAATTAVVTSLVLVVVAVLMLPADPDELLFNVVQEPGLRYGTVLGMSLLVVPLLLLLHQALRLGNASRQRRLAGLRIAGVTAREARLLGAGEVAVPALVGSLLGIVGFGVLRSVLGGGADGGPSLVVGDYGYSVALVPTSVTPTWWMVTSVVAGVTALGVLLGLRTGSGVSDPPHGVSRRSAARAPRPWGACVLVALVLLTVPAAVVPPVAYALFVDGFGTLALVAVTVLAFVSTGPWAAHLAGRVAQDRASTVPVLLAARRLVVDPRPAGRAGAAVGGVGLVAGGVGVLLGDVVGSGGADFFFVFSYVLVALGLLVTLLLVSLTLAVHSVETLTDRRRSMASLHALGVPATDVRRSQQWEGYLVAVPMSLVGTLLGAWTVGGTAVVDPAAGPAPLVLTLACVVLTPVLAACAVRLAVALTGPVARRVVDPEHLRTA
ncbi:hypothetical protein ASG49_17855 [Marmoricola sp. Leaf446]|uniref:FtsX-like permease family protein n=1 Tax=Marmoricola sp. Leaf446 TaxID=1736379 RepID=UPI0006F5D614|nr:FtsX-like permease family protein [Marmoricola sp. Leaf446]KQT89591.1 hypothetical protein ASG49_17855 [Marmoricola sp. Leaf446]